MTTDVSDTALARRVIAALTAFVLVAVTLAVTLGPRGVADGGPSVLASVNAGVNATAACALVAGFVAIRRRAVALHRACMLVAFGLSSLFLVLYLVHHSQVGSIPYGGQGWVRWVYFSFLIPHILLAAAIIPLALFTIYRAWTNRLVAHRRVARWTLPIWLYVSVSGVVVYWMLYWT